MVGFPQAKNFWESSSKTTGRLQFSGDEDLFSRSSSFFRGKLRYSNPFRFSTLKIWQLILCYCDEMPLMIHSRMIGPARWHQGF